MTNRTVGSIGEDSAADYLRRLGWRVLTRNWRCPQGELDIVAHDPAARAVVFCEVKCRSGLGYGDPLEAITPLKVNKLRELATRWLEANRQPAPRIRLDGIGVLLRRGAEPLVTHVRGIGG